MAKIDEVVNGYEQRVKEHTDLNQMIASPRSESVFSATVQDIRKKLELNSGVSLLDAGCGNGLIMRSLAEYCQSVVGADLTEKLLNVARIILPDSSFICSEAGNLPFDSATFDRVLCYSVFLHFHDWNYTKKTISELSRVCKPGGLVLIGDLPNRKLRRIPIKLRWEIIYRFHVLRRRHPGPSIFNPLRFTFYEISKLESFINSLHFKVDFLSQPSELIAAEYRFDCLIHVT